MLIGILSDSHGRLDATRSALNLLRARGAEYLIHCGDVGDERIIDLLAGELVADKIRAAFVFGNNDYDRDQLATYANSLQVACLGIFGELELDHKTFAITHGDNPTLVRKILAEQSHDYLLLGHSHVMSDQRHGRTRVINPGALYRAAVKSVALLSTAEDRLEFLPITV